MWWYLGWCGAIAVVWVGIVSLVEKCLASRVFVWLVNWAKMCWALCVFPCLPTLKMFACTPTVKTYMHHQMCDVCFVASLLYSYQLKVVCVGACAYTYVHCESEMHGQTLGMGFTYQNKKMSLWKYGFPNASFLSYSTDRMYLQEMLTISFIQLNKCLCTSYHGLLNPFKDPGIAADGLTGVHNVLMKCLYIVKGSWIHKGL
jgi:hypothetical protein